MDPKLEKAHTTSLYAAMHRSFQQLQEQVTLKELERVLESKDPGLVIAVLDVEERLKELLGA